MPIRTRDVLKTSHERATVPAVSCSGWPIYRPLAVILLMVFWTEQKTREKTPQLPLYSIFVPLGYSLISIHLKTKI